MIRADDVIKLEKIRSDTKKQLYTAIHLDFCKKIKAAAAMNNRQVFLTTPVFMFGYPSYDVKKATVYIRRQLELSGFNAIVISDNQIHVSWGSSKPTPVEKEPLTHSESLETFPTFVNLRKVASKIKNRA
jgi:hypothetical protein